MHACEPDKLHPRHLILATVEKPKHQIITLSPGLHADRRQPFGGTRVFSPLRRRSRNRGTSLARLAGCGTSPARLALRRGGWLVLLLEEAL